MPRSNTHREVEHIHPILLRGHFVHAMRTMRMGIDKAGNDRLACDVNGLCTRRNGEVARFANSLNPVIFNQDYGIVDYAAVLVSHGDNACAGEGNDASWTIGLHSDGERNALLRRCEFYRLCVLGQRAIGIEGIGLRRLER